MRDKRVSVDFKSSRILLPASIPEGVEWIAHYDIDEADVRKHRFPAFARKATGYSSRP